VRPRLAWSGGRLAALSDQPPSPTQAAIAFYRRHQGRRFCRSTGIADDKTTMLTLTKSTQTGKTS